MARYIIVGLGNPGEEYRAHRHNIGARFVQELAAGAAFKKESASPCRKAALAGTDHLLVLPDVFMNESGRAVASFMKYYRASLPHLLVVHDELDLPCGVARFKRGGGHAGHNGLGDIIARLGSGDFYRLRIGIGHPGDKRRVNGYVLRPAPPAEEELCGVAMAHAKEHLPLALSGGWDKATTALHTALPAGN